VHATLPSQAQIGPNALIQMVEALRSVWGNDKTGALLGSLGLGHYIEKPPQRMMPQVEVAALHTRLYGMVDVQTFKSITFDAGSRTADYLLANRIPGAVQWLLKRLPDAVAARVLCRAIAKHAWTFAGSGAFSYAWEPHLVFRLRGNPLCSQIDADTPVCDYYAATFERIFRVVVNDNWRVQELQCEASGANVCEFTFCLVGDLPPAQTNRGAKLPIS
jgi:divinyl protochlorophyllide a 8-vinyl-reductase